MCVHALCRKGWEPPGADGSANRPIKNFERHHALGKFPERTIKERKGERVGLYVIFNYVKVTVVGDPEERVGQVKVREWRHSRMAYAETRDNGRLLIDD